MALASLVPLAVLPFGAVHEPVRLLVAFAAVVVSLAAMLPLPERAGPSVRGLIVAALPLAVWAFSAVAFVEVGPAMRAALQPGYAHALDAGLAAAGLTTHSLAIAPRDAALGWASAGATALVLIATATLICNERRGFRAATVLVGAGLAVGGLHVAHVLSGAQSILWFTGIGADTSFVGPFVYKNAAGAFAAALLPLAVAIGTHGPLIQRQLGLGSAFAIGALALGSGSRAAILLVPIALAIYAALIGGPLARRVVAGLAAIVALALLAWGPSDALSAVTVWMRPEQRGFDVFTGRLDLWADTPALVAGAPLLGIGFGGFADGYPLMKSSGGFVLADHMHQDLAETAVTQGLPALLAWIAAGLAWAAIALRRALVEADHEEGAWIAAFFTATVTLLLAGLVDFPLRIGGLAMLASVTAGATLGMATYADRESPRWLWFIARGVSVGAGALTVATLAVVALRLGRFAPEPDYATADEPALTAALARRPLDWRASFALAQRRDAAGDVPGTRAWLDLTLTQYPTFPWAWLSLARLERASHREIDARAAYATLLTLEVPARDLQSLMREALRGIPPSDYEQVVPPRGDRLCFAGAIANEQGDLEVAERYMRRALADFPGCGPVLAMRLFEWGRGAQVALDELAPYDGCDATRIEAMIRGTLAEPEQVLALRERALSECGANRIDVRIELAEARLENEDLSGFDILEAVIRDDSTHQSARRILIAWARRYHRLETERDHVRWLVAHDLATPEEKLRYDAIRD